MKLNLNKDYDFGRKKINEQRKMKGYELHILFEDIKASTETDQYLGIAYSNAFNKAYLAGFAQGYKQAKAEIRRAKK